MEGWIKIHRQLLKWEWWDDHNTTRLFLFLLLQANHEPQKWRGHIIEKGQLVTGRLTLAKNTGITPQCIRTSLERLKSTNEITIKSTNRFSLITINNYAKYQQTNQLNNQQTNKQLTSNQPATNQQLTTNKNERMKEYKNEKKEEINNKSPTEITAQAPKVYGNEDINKMLIALKGRIGVSAFADSVIERNMAKHCVNLMGKIGVEEFQRRLDILLQDQFHHKNCNKIKYVYNQIKGWIEPQVKNQILHL